LTQDFHYARNDTFSGQCATAKTINIINNDCIVNNLNASDVCHSRMH